MKLKSGPESLLIIIPCFNEEGAIAHVVADIKRVLPAVPILVVDDASADATVTVAREAGAQVLTLPHHLGLGGAVQAGYKLAYEYGFRYVIRVDGDGQHSAEDIPRVFEVLRQSGAQMVIGSRYIRRQRNYTNWLRGFGIGHGHFFCFICGRAASAFTLSALKSSTNFSRSAMSALKSSGVGTGTVSDARLS